MKTLTTLAALFALLIPIATFAAFNTNSADLELSSSQRFSRADTASLSITGSFTHEAWIKMETLPTTCGGCVYPIVEKNDAGSNRSTTFVVQDGGGGNNLLSCTADQTGDNTDTSAVDYTWTGVSTGVWYRVACSFNSATGRIDVFVGDETNAVTSVANNTGTASALFDGNASTYIGFQGGTSRFFDGKVALVRFWSTTQTASQIETNKCTKLGSTTNLAAEWTLDNTENDNSGNSNTLTNVNTVPYVADVPSCAAAATFKPWQMFPF